MKKELKEKNSMKVKERLPYLCKFTEEIIQRLTSISHTGNPLDGLTCIIIEIIRYNTQDLETLFSKTKEKIERIKDAELRREKYRNKIRRDMQISEQEEILRNFKNGEAVDLRNAMRLGRKKIKTNLTKDEIDFLSVYCRFAFSDGQSKSDKKIKNSLTLKAEGIIEAAICVRFSYKLFEDGEIYLREF